VSRGSYNLGVLIEVSVWLKDLSTFVENNTWLKQIQYFIIIFIPSRWINNCVFWMDYNLKKVELNAIKLRSIQDCINFICSCMFESFLTGYCSSDILICRIYVCWWYVDVALAIYFDTVNNDVISEVGLYRPTNRSPCHTCIRSSLISCFDKISLWTHFRMLNPLHLVFIKIFVHLLWIVKFVS